MKKLISLFAILAMVFSMQSCINSGDTPDATQTIALKATTTSTSLPKSTRLCATRRQNTKWTSTFHK